METTFGQVTPDTGTATVTPMPGAGPYPIQIGLQNDFKTAALWALVGVVAGVCLGVWLTKQNFGR